jgi:enoyl-CoA hydratase
VTSTTSDAGLRIDHDGSVLVLTLDRPPHNFYDDSLQDQLLAAWRSARADPGVRVVVLRAAGKNFCGGHDPAHAESPEGGSVAMALYHEQSAVPMPTIAAVQGACVGGGLRFAWACDLIYASEDAYFRDPTVALGRPGIGYLDGVRDVGLRIAKEMLFLGDGIGARRLATIGAINGVVQREALWEWVDELASRISEQPVAAIRGAKTDLDRGGSAPRGPSNLSGGREAGSSDAV